MVHPTSQPRSDRASALAIAAGDGGFREAHTLDLEFISESQTPKAPRRSDGILLIPNAKKTPQKELDQAMRRYYADPSVKLGLRAARKIRKSDCKAIAREYKLEHPCACGEANPLVLCFRNNKEAIFALDHAMRGRLVKSLPGTKIVCLNCTALEHWKGTGKRMRIWAAREKMAVGCKDCGIKEPGCLDFDHRDPSLKTECVSHLCRDGSSLDRIKAEVALCDVRCRNCHMKRHLS